eukprot:m.17405 g.17405  ORF g.17405 m.17405 type:complete len:104 (+) comp9294_c0_seq1:390-701(+)
MSPLLRMVGYVRRVHQCTGHTISGSAGATPIEWFIGTSVILDHWPLDRPEESGQYTSQAGIRVKGSIHLGRELLIVIRLQNLRVSDRDLHRRVHHLRVIFDRH